MAEINNNMSNYGYGIEKIEKKNKEGLPKEQKAQQTDIKEQAYVPDTGVLGRSQVKGSRGGNISKSVDEAVSLAVKNPGLLTGSETLFNCIYNDYLQSGMEPSEAYMKALIAEEEFMEMGVAYNR